MCTYSPIPTHYSMVNKKLIYTVNFMLMSVILSRQSERVAMVLVLCHVLPCVPMIYQHTLSFVQLRTLINDSHSMSCNILHVLHTCSVCFFCQCRKPNLL